MTQYEVEQMEGGEVRVYGDPQRSDEFSYLLFGRIGEVGDCVKGDCRKERA